MAKIRIKGDTSGYVDLEAPDAASSSTLNLDQVPQKNVANTFTTAQTIQNDNSYWAANIAESSHASVALRVTPTRAGYTKGISLGAIGKNGALSTGIQAYDTSDNSSNTLELNPHGGAVTTPNQPAFFAHRNGGNYTETTATAKVYIDGTRFNHGGHYDTTNNRFVAPVDGVYQFNASVNCYYIESGKQLRAFLYVNGSNYVVGDSFHSANNSHDLVASVSHAINLSANDYVEVWSFSDDGSRGFSSSAVWNTFSGYLLG